MALAGWIAMFAGAVLIYAGFTGQNIVAELARIFGKQQPATGGGGGRLDQVQ